MTGENFSVTKCSLNKRQGDQVVDIKISNQNEENAKSFNIRATDQETKEQLTIHLGGVEIDHVNIEPKSYIIIQVDLSKAKNLYDLEISSNSSGGGMSIRQSSSNGESGKKHLVEVVLR